MTLSAGWAAQSVTAVGQALVLKYSDQSPPAAASARLEFILASAAHAELSPASLRSSKAPLSSFTAGDETQVTILTSFAAVNVGLLYWWSWPRWSVSPLAWAHSLPQSMAAVTRAIKGGSYNFRGHRLSVSKKMSFSGKMGNKRTGSRKLDSWRQSRQPFDTAPRLARRKTCRNGRRDSRTWSQLCLGNRSEWRFSAFTGLRLNMSRLDLSGSGILILIPNYSHNCRGHREIKLLFRGLASD